MRDLLSEWREQATVVGVSGALVAAAVIVVIVALTRQFGAYEELARAVRDREAAVLARDEVESQLRQSQKLEAMGQLTSGVAHDFNNLLTVVLGNLDLLGRRLPPGAEGMARYVDGARSGAERAAALTQRLLAFARRTSLEPRDVDLNGLVGDMADLLRQSLGENMVLRLDLEPALAPVLADPGQLEGALLNLVVNARDAMGGGGTVTIETRAGASGAAATGAAARFVLLTVADTGAGMTPEVMRRAFEPFFTTKPVGVGTGLGLAQVYGFAKQSAGDVRIESEPGAGTRVILSLPCLKGAEAVGHVAQGGGRRALDAVVAATGLVLVVDDNAGVRRFSAEVLSGAGFTVLEAEDGPAALRIVDGEPIVGLFTDIGLPGMDGRDLAAEAARRRPGLAVLMTTGYAPDVLRRSGRPDPDGPILRKPFTADSLVSAFRSALGAGRPA